MDLDAILDNAANSVLDKPAAAATSTAVKPAATPVPAEIKPWLASSANVPKEIREKWTKYVKEDRNAKILSKFQPSHSYRSWDSQPLNTSKLVGDLVRKVSAINGYDEVKTSKLMSTYQPNTETEFSKRLQSAYYATLIHDLKNAIQADPNYNAEKFPQLARILSK